MSGPTRIRIGTLALHGVPAGAQEAMIAALQEELGRAAATADLPAGTISVARLRLDPVSPGTDAAATGRAIAAALLRALPTIRGAR
jgi:hypothetical protein